MNWRKGLGTVTQEFLVLYLPNVYSRVPGHPAVPGRNVTQSLFSRNISSHFLRFLLFYKEVKDCFSSYLRATTACSCGSEGASNEGPLVLAWSLPSQDVPDAGNREQFPLSLDVRGCFVISFVDEESVSLIRLLLYRFCHGIGTEYLFSRTRSAICIPNCSWQCRRPTNANLPEAWPIRASM